MYGELTTVFSNQVRLNLEQHGDSILLVAQSNNSKDIKDLLKITKKSSYSDKFVVEFLSEDISLKEKRESVSTEVA